METALRLSESSLHYVYPMDDVSRDILSSCCVLSVLTWVGIFAGQIRRPHEANMSLMYRNKAIIAAIHYAFVKGDNSTFDLYDPSFYFEETEQYEVPLPMVAFAGTAVSH